MKRRLVLFTLGTLASLALQAQSFTQRAIITGGGSRDEGKCTIEVVVDDAAQVEVRGDTAVLRTLRGHPAEWRRFQCNTPMPLNPAGLRFEGRDGRGLQQLVRDNRNSGATVVYIEDRDSGREGYTFDLIWGNGGYGDPRSGGYQNGPAYSGAPGYSNGPQYNNGPYPSGPYDNHRNGGFEPRDAIRACQDAVRDRARDRFGFRSVSFDDVRLEPGRNRDHGWVVGSFEARHGWERERFTFRCGVDFDDRRIGNIDIDPARRW